MLKLKIWQVLIMCFKAWGTWALPLEELSVVADWLNEVYMEFFFLSLNPKSRISAGEPGAKAAVVLDIFVAPIAPVALAFASTAFSPPIALAILSCFIVLRAFSLFLLSSSSVSPFLIASRLTKPYILSMSCTWRLICFCNTTRSLSI